ncbi:LysR family transcriptional regulator [Mycobacterium sp. 852002-51057_SCH5723018]|uniref:LysR family transcriptional regulator n=1 Tax=Mycobacterium sp. 852002-51057_SCH5723018 TaxID=1834094 RepID=UPI0007FE2DB8|nr:LysR family transcriptional regulator [Mycobacterium sp. 852002-51057_SCH5723018]OBG24628.1 LysR family transcriptional regulator [Mycobacterium sp. 852002-51057_SCH5723018]
MATLLQLKAFLAVIDEGGFTAASRSLGLSQPAVSRAVASLEKDLGSPLLIRERERIVLNAAGRRAVKHAREAMRHLDQMRAEVSAAGHVRGTLRMASLPFTTELLIAPQLQKFSEHHPCVEIRVLEGGEPEIRDWLDLGAADAGVISLPENGLEAAFLSAQDMVAVIPSEHRLADFVEIHYSDLAKEPFIRATGGCSQVFMAVAGQVGVEFDVAFEAHGMTAVLEMVNAGLGVSILPVAAVPGPSPGIAVRRLVPKTIRNLAVAVSASAGPAARAFLDQIAALDHS